MYIQKITIAIGTVHNSGVETDDHIVNTHYSKTSKPNFAVPLLAADPHRGRNCGRIYSDVPAGVGGAAE